MLKRVGVFALILTAGLTTLPGTVFAQRNDCGRQNYSGYYDQHNSWGDRPLHRDWDYRDDESYRHHTDEWNRREWRENHWRDQERFRHQNRRDDRDYYNRGYNDGYYSGYGR